MLKKTRKRIESYAEAFDRIDKEDMRHIFEEMIRKI
ncbi:MAG: hypothetical protein PWP28_1858 [Oceanotoga sp.]|jgi:hypothetical protein|uniref:Uncharacterized protein n=1 Tax=Oceanotoga teriensis TaxID=515440 RepID=A0AA45C5A5_9BACT|nr:hypothetical protein [Oceanotoga sp.]PWJ88523.1 hypothetical protein C7380_11835 [Oceanotoga teriensis]